MELHGLWVRYMVYWIPDELSHVTIMSVIIARITSALAVLIPDYQDWRGYLLKTAFELRPLRLQKNESRLGSCCAHPRACHRATRIPEGEGEGGQ